MQKWENLSITQRLALGFMLLLAINITMLAVIRSWQGQSTVANREYAERAAPQYELATDLQHQILNVSIAIRTHLLAPSPETRREFDAEVLAARDQLSRLSGFERTPVGDSMFSRIPSRLEGYLGEAVRMLDGAPDAIGERGLSALRTELVTDLGTFTDLQERNAAASLSAIARAQSRVTKGVVTAAVASTLAFLLIAWLIVRAVRQPVLDLVKVADAMEAGDWHPALELSGKFPSAQGRNELVHLAAAFGAAAEAIERRENRLHANRAIAGAASAALVKESIARPALRAIADHLNAEIGMIYRISRDNLQLIPVATRGLDQSEPVSALEGLPGRAVVERSPALMTDIPADTPFRIRVGYDESLPRMIVAVPLLARDNVYGVIVLATLRNLDKDAIDFLESAAQQLAVGFQNVRAYDDTLRLLADVELKNAAINSQNEEIQSQNEELQTLAEEIQAQNEELQAQGEEIRAQNDELTEQAEVLRGQAVVLTESAQRQHDFIALLAHELRNPMATLSNNLFVLRHVGGTSPAEVRAREAMERQSRQLTRLMDDLLDITRISHGKIRLQRQPIDLATVVLECIEDLQSLAGKSGVALVAVSPEESVLIDGDRSRISQVICNLVDNAIKASETGGEVTVTVGLTSDRSHALVQVVDRGVGIDPAGIDRLFQPFVQGPYDAHGNGGLGLGLALVRTLVELHDGTVEAHSKGSGQGSEFLLRFPLAVPAPTPHVAADLGERELTARRRVVIIEDNLDAAHSLRDALLHEGHEVRLASNASEGLSLLREFQPDVAFCDIGLPDVDGYSVAAQVARQPEMSRTLLVALSGYATPGDIDRARAAGFHHHFAKPAPMERLRDLLRDLKI
jgi:signal transduction histidine kinase/CheY-like chemotaxis protein